jgi:hypothetical protein
MEAIISALVERFESNFLPKNLSRPVMSLKSLSADCDSTADRVRRGILQPNGTFRGMTYSGYLREWLIALHSDAPNFRGYHAEICYLYGNYSFTYDRDTGTRRQREAFQNNAINTDDEIFRGSTIWSDTAIFVPVMTSFYCIGENYYGNTLQTVADLHFVCRRDLDEGGPNWCTLQRNGCDIIDLINEVHYYESPSFKLTVTENSPFRQRIEIPIEPGTYVAFVAAYAIMLNTSNDPNAWLTPGYYRLQYGGNGRLSYRSDSVQDFVVQPVPGRVGRFPPGTVGGPAGGRAPPHAGLIPVS